MNNNENLFMEQVQKDPMPFTLITEKGKIMRFYIKETAELYQRLEGGVIVTEGVLKVSGCKEIA